VIVPPAPGHFSAWGMLMSDLRHDLVQTRLLRSGQATIAEMDAIWRDLEERMRAVFAEEGTEEAEKITLFRAADMRYAGQEHTVEVPVPADTAEMGEIEERFHELHERLYTFRQDSPVEFVNFRLTGFGAVSKPELQEIPAGGDARNALKGVREVDFDELGRHEASIYDRNLLGAGSMLEGPAVVEEPAASTVVFPDQRLKVDERGCLIIEEV
jgi:N-methylhydantoinase A